MTSRHLVPCAACSRHVRAFEARCPFCNAAIDGTSIERAPALPSERLSRAAIFAFSTTVALAGCQLPAGDAPSPQAPPIAPQPLPAPVPVVVQVSPAQPQMLPIPAPQVAPTNPVVPPPHVGPVAVRYGGPARPNHPSTLVPAYGGPPPRTHEGSMSARYGAPPVDDFER
jgi:hypothetical protein